jgi:hypothetical protein
MLSLRSGASWGFWGEGVSLALRVKTQATIFYYILLVFFLSSTIFTKCSRSHTVQANSESNIPKYSNLFNPMA